VADIGKLRGLYAITPQLAPDLLLARVEAALKGGVSLLQYRDKSAREREKVALARALAALCRRYGALFIVNDDVRLAQDVDADGVHLGSDDGDLIAARRVLGAGKLIGASCYASLDRARRAQQSGADYVAFGALYRSPTKPLAPPAPLALLGACRAELGLPVCAIGGITLANAPATLAAGADLLAVVSDLFDAPDVGARAQAFQQLFLKERAS
jgi:thiamine-phosphate pyrophosphorylase